MLRKIVGAVCVISFSFIFYSCSSENTSEPANHPPEITSLSANPDVVGPSGSVVLICTATDPDGDNLNYIWEASSGSISGSGDSVIWHAPDSTGNFPIICRVLDGNGGEDNDQVEVEVEQQIPTDGLIAYWSFNGNANDESGNGNNETVYGATLTSDRFGNENSAYIFNGNGDYINTNFTPSLIFTISIWYNKVQNQKENAGLFSTYSGGTNYSGVYYAMNGNYDWIRCDGNSLDAFSSSALNWKHIVIISDGTKVKVYENTNKILDFIGTTNHSNFLVIGDSRYNGRYFTGKIDDIHVYNRALTEEEIQLLYHIDGWGN